MIFNAVHISNKVRLETRQMEATSYETSKTLSALIEKVDAMSIKIAKLEKVVNKIGEELSHTSTLFS